MATSQQSVTAGTIADLPRVSRALGIPWIKALLPSFSDCFFLAMFAWLFLAGQYGWQSLLADGDIGWHIRTGEWILAHHTVPTHDLFSFSKPDAPWFAWEWLADVLFASLFHWAGFKGVVLLAAAIIGIYPTIVLRHAFWRGADAMIALPLVLLAVSSSIIHFLARPHVFTFLFLAAGIWLLERDRREPTRWLWLLIPVTVLWVNLHGGFFVFLACLGLLVAGTAVEAWLDKSLRWRFVRRYTLLFCGCAFASVINPYGINLHRHVAGYLSSDWIRNNIQEFQAPTFRSEAQTELEVILIFALLIVIPLLGRRRIPEALWILFLVHSSLTSLRHGPLLCLVAVPFIAEEFTIYWRRATARFPRGSILGILRTLGADAAVPFRRTGVLIPLTLVIVALSPLRWPQDFPSTIYPTALVARNLKYLESGPVLTSDQWGDYLIFHYYPHLKVFMDGRSDFYGEQLGKEYLHVLQLAPGWQRILEGRRFTTVLLGPEWPLVQQLKGSPDWQIVEETPKAILFVRRSSGTAAAGGAGPGTTFVLKKTRSEANENLQRRRSLYTGDRRNERA